MCLLTFFDPDVMPDMRALEYGADANPDGHGYAIVTRNNRLLLRRGMRASQILDAFERDRRAHPSGPALFHSRIATGGTVDKSNCHPFYVGGDRRTVLAHNGILFQPHKNDHRSDTRILASRLLPKRWPYLDEKKCAASFRKYLGSFNKVAILTTDPGYQKRSYLFGADNGWWEDGIWYSNTSYLPPLPPTRYAYSYDGTTGTYKPKWWDDAAPHTKARRWYLPTPCEVCGEPDTVHTVTLMCEVCDSCQDCLERREDCQCWVKYSTSPLGEGVRHCQTIGSEEEEEGSA